MTDVLTYGTQQRCTWRWLCTDLVAAAFASALVSPWYAAIDKFVHDRATKGMSMRATVESWFKHPKKAQRAFGIPFLIYFGVFATANLFDSAYAIQNDLEPNFISTTTSKTLATTAVAVGLGIQKDCYFAKLATKTPVPFPSFLMFALRDAITVYSTFVLPTTIATSLATSNVWSYPLMSEILHSDISTLAVAQIAMPVASQLISTPVHLLGLDINNRRIGFAAQNRLRQLQRNLSFATRLRIARVLPSFGIGGSLNTGCKGYLHDLGLK